MTAVSIVDRLSDQSLMADIATAATPREMRAAMTELKRARIRRGVCAVCSGLIPPGRRTVYCGPVCSYQWQLDESRLDQRTWDGRWRSLSLACCETDEQRASRPAKQTRGPRRSQQSRERLWRVTGPSLVVERRP